MDAEETLGGSRSVASTTFEPGSQIAGRYRVDRFIAAGAMGEVFAAEDLLVGAKVALKVLRPELADSASAVERLRREIALARKVTDNHVCRLHDLGQHANRVFLTMELLDGVTLADRIADQGPLPVIEVERLAKQLVAGLAALHAAGIVHRDFKSANTILIGDGDTGRAVITDFGLARSIHGTDDGLTVEASLLGTPAYMAPEQVEGRAATPASDIYALGVVMFEMLTGRRPFAKETPMATATARLHEQPPRPSSVRAEIPHRWDAIVSRCLARDAADRFARVQDVLAEDVEAVVTGRRGRQRWVAGAGAIAVAGTITTILITRPGTQPEIGVAVECPSSKVKLAEVWNPFVRSRAAARYFADGRAHIADTFESHARQFDNLTVQWARRWDAACGADDRSSDPLLYGQRLACLDANLIEIAGYARGFTTPDVTLEQFALGTPGEFPIIPSTECDLVPMLRAQPAPPPAAVRSDVEDVMLQSHRLRARLRFLGGENRTEADPTLVALAELEQRVATLGHGSGANEIAYWRSMFLAQFGKVDDASKVVAEMLARATRSRDDRYIAAALVRQAAHRSRHDAVYDAPAVQGLLARATEIVDGLGNPVWMLAELAEGQVAHARRLQRPRELIAALTKLGALQAEQETRTFALWTRGEVVKLRAWNGEIDTEEAAAILKERAALTGPSSTLLVGDLIQLSQVFARAGDHAAAYAYALQAISICERARMTRPSIDAVQSSELAFEFAFELGQASDAERHLRAAIAMAKSQMPELRAHVDLAGRLRARGRRAAARHVAEQATRLAGDATEHAKAWAVLAELGLEAGERLGDEWTARLEPEVDAANTLAVIDARAGRSVQALSRTDTIPEGLPGAIAKTRVLVELGRPKQAVEEIEKAMASKKRARTPWLGLARFAAGDLANAIGPLRDALWREAGCCEANGTIAHELRFALARALWATGGDRDEARTLAHAASAGFQQLGLTTKQREVERWSETAR